MATSDSLFFSIVVPAHNEAAYLADTIAALRAQSYPEDRFEVLIIENGSTDRTPELAQELAGGNVKAYSFPKKGVSAARNRGMELARADADWVMFLDADTLVAPAFLTDLYLFMRKKQLWKYAAGSMSIQPITERLGIKLFFRTGNFVRRFTKFPYACFLIRRTLLEKLQFDETQEVGEDARLFADACRFGHAFFFHTSAVRTSVRRYTGMRWLRTVRWLSMMPLAGRAFHKTRYAVIR